MDENTRFLIERIDQSKSDLMGEIQELRKAVDALTAFKNRVVGMALVAGGIGSAVFEVIKSKMGG